MARNHQRVEPQSESGEESGSDSDQRTPTPNVANPDESSSSSQEESGSGSDRNGSRRSRSDAGPAVAKAREDGERKTDATAKKSSDDSKKLLFQRIWSEDDEIAILNGITEYSSEKKSDPMADLDAFHGFIKKNLQVDVTRTQLQHKIRRLKKKYQNNTNRAKDGKARKFSKSHEQKAYDLSKTVWGNEVGKIKGGGENRVGSNLSTLIECEKSILGKRSSNLGVAERILRAGAELFEGGEGVKGEKEWKKLKRDEVELYCKELELKLAQSRLVLDVLKPNYR